MWVQKLAALLALMCISVNRTAAGFSTRHFRPTKSLKQTMKQTQSRIPEDQKISQLGLSVPEFEEDRWTPLSLTSKVLLPIQLALSLYALLLLPCALALETWYCLPRVLALLYGDYLAFFLLLLLPRAYKYGKFAKPISSKNNKKKATSIVEVLVFISALVGSHWRAVYQFSEWDKSMVFSTPLRAIRWFSILLVGLSGRALGKSYDRVTRPDELVQEGPYGVVRHPIYSAYLLLFGSSLLTLRSYGSSFLLLAIASWFYKHRMDSEDEVLAETFGEDFERYKERVPWRMVPFIF